MGTVAAGMEAIDRLLSSAESHRLKTGKPRVTLSYAQSLDGSLAERRGSPLALSGPASLQLTHRLRAAHDAILVGIGTVLADNPRLTVRLVQGENPQPVVLDSRLRIPLDSNLLSGPRTPWIATTAQAPQERRTALENAGARLLLFPPAPHGRVPLPALLECLAGLEVNSLMVEGGAEVIASLLSQNLADQVILTLAPRFVGGLHIEMNGLLSSLPRLKDVDFQKLGDDLILWGKLSP